MRCRVSLCAYYILNAYIRVTRSAGKLNYIAYIIYTEISTSMSLSTILLIYLINQSICLSISIILFISMCIYLSVLSVCLSMIKHLTHKLIRLSSVAFSVTHRVSINIILLFPFLFPFICFILFC